MKSFTIEQKTIIPFNITITTTLPLKILKKYLNLILVQIMESVYLKEEQLAQIAKEMEGEKTIQSTASKQYEKLFADLSRNKSG